MNLSIPGAKSGKKNFSVLSQLFRQTKAISTINF